MPRTYGESFVHVSEIDGFLCSWEPLPESARPKIGEEDRAIGKYIAELVRDGDCLQLGSVRCRMRSARSSATSTTLVCIPR